MIKIKIETKDNKIFKVVITGHANYDDYGKDIVCAAVSATAISTINNILSLEDTIEYLEEKDKLVINVIKSTDINDKLLSSMISMFKELEIDYQKNIKIY